MQSQCWTCLNTIQQLRSPGRRPGSSGWGKQEEPCAAAAAAAPATASAADWPKPSLSLSCFCLLAGLPPSPSLNDATVPSRLQRWRMTGLWLCASQMAASARWGHRLESPSPCHYLPPAIMNGKTAAVCVCVCVYVCGWFVYVREKKQLNVCRSLCDVLYLFAVLANLLRSALCCFISHF